MHPVSVHGDVHNCVSRESVFGIRNNMVRTSQRAREDLNLALLGNLPHCRIVWRRLSPILTMSFTMTDELVDEISSSTMCWSICWTNKSCSSTQRVTLQSAEPVCLSLVGSCAASDRAASSSEGIGLLFWRSPIANASGTVASIFLCSTEMKEMFGAIVNNLVDDLGIYFDKALCEKYSDLRLEEPTDMQTVPDL